MKIGELMERDFGRPIEEIIKVNNTDEETVYTELTEYVATDRIRREYEHLFRAFADAPTIPNEGVGVWISGFFGSGKSSFAKNLGYVLSNRNVRGERSSEIFVRQLRDERITNLVELLNAKIPCQVFMFDVQVDLSVQNNSEQIAEVMYRVLLRDLNYAEDYDIAEIETELEREGRLEALVAACQQLYSQPWARVRKGGQKYSRTSALLHEIDPRTYPAEDSWMLAVKARPLRTLSVKDIVDRAFDLCARRCPGKTFLFIIDEVGQYVSRSAEKLENLRAVIEQFGRVSMERLKRREIPGPSWIIVTSQEKLQEVYNHIASGRIDLPKLQDRFKHQIDLSPADIREVASRRVLAKLPGQESVLQELYRKNQGNLTQACRLERTPRTVAVSEDEFVQFYPYLPHLVDLSIDVMAGIRLQPNTPKHLGGSNRTIIKQSYEMLAGDRTRLLDAPIGTLVTLDKVYELVEGNLPSERQKDIADIQRQMDPDHDYPGMASRVAKALCLLEFVRNLPRTPANIAALLVDTVGTQAPLAAVQATIERLQKAQFIREADDGWKLQSAKEKNWEEERRTYANVNRAERAAILQSTLGTLVRDPRIKAYNYQNLHTFTLAFSIDGQGVNPSGQVPFDLISCDPDELQQTVQRTAAESLRDDRRNRIAWIFTVTPEIEEQIRELQASKRMVEKYQHTASQQSITSDERELLTTERNRLHQIEIRLGRALTAEVEKGFGVFRAGKHASGDLGRDFAEMVRGLCDQAIPDLFPKAEMGCRPVSGKEAEEFLRQANLSGLPPIFYDGEEGLNLVVREGNHSLPNVHAPIAVEILDYLRREQSYGNKVVGSRLAEYFGGFGFGWDKDVVRLVLAVLFRAGSIEVTHQGKRYRDYQDPLARTPFANHTAFNAAGFAPREAIDIRTLAAAVRVLEAMLGREVNVEESAITQEFQKMCAKEREVLLPALANARAKHLPVAQPLEEWLQTLDTALAGGSDDCVRMLASEGHTIQIARDRAQQICRALSETALAAIDEARSALHLQIPELRHAGDDRVEADARELEELLASPSLLENVSRISALSREIDAGYREVWATARATRRQKYQQAIDTVTAQPEWEDLDAEQRERALQQLRRRAEDAGELPPFAAGDGTGTTLERLSEDLDLLPSLQAGALAQIRPVRKPEGPTAGADEVVRLSDFLPASISLPDLTEEEINQALERLREKLFSLRELKRTVTWA